MKKFPLVVLHGWGLSGVRFKNLVGELAKDGYEVFAPDFPGFGHSLVPDRPWALVDYVQFLSEFIRKKRLAKPVLIGHSFGGRVALKFNELFPSRARALILTGVPGFTPIPKRRLALFIALAKLGGGLFSIPPLSFFKGPVRRWYYYVVGAKEFFRAEGAMRETFKNIVREDLVSSMEAVSIPTLLIWGEKDSIVPMSIAERMHKTIVGSVLIVIPNADHGVPYKQPEIFTSYVMKFLNNV